MSSVRLSDAAGSHSYPRICIVHLLVAVLCVQRVLALGACAAIWDWSTFGTRCNNVRYGSSDTTHALGCVLSLLCRMGGPMANSRAGVARRERPRVFCSLRFRGKKSAMRGTRMYSKKGLTAAKPEDAWHARRAAALVLAKRFAHRTQLPRARLGRDARFKLLPVFTRGESRQPVLAPARAGSTLSTRVHALCANDRGGL